MTATPQPNDRINLRAIFARNLEMWLFANNLTAVQLAQKMMVSAHTVYRLQKGELTSISFDTIEKLKDVTDMSYEELFTRRSGVVYR